MKTQLLKTCIVALALVLSVGMDPHAAHAQPTPELPFNAPVEGAITAPGETQTWQFSALEGAMVSLRARGLSGDLDPVLTLRNASGAVLIDNDDYDYPNTLDALLQGITLPRTGTYTVTVSSHGNTTGTFSLALHHGYAGWTPAEPFDGDALWSASLDALQLTPTADTLTLEMPNPSRWGYAFSEGSPVLSDFYTRARINVSGRNGWTVGFTLREGEAGRYVLALNQRGQWRLQWVNDQGERRTIRDWTNHPAIRAGETDFTLGVLVNRRGFDVFYNDAYVGQAIDAEGYAREGRVGFWLETPDAAGSSATARFSQHSHSLPVRHSNGAEIVPQRLMSGSLGLTVQELERRRLIAPGGVQALTVPESSGRELTPNVNRVLLGRGVTFGEMVLSTTFTLQATPGALVGCGLLFGNTSETRYTVAFLDATGAYGVALRDGARFDPAMFNESNRPDWTQGRQHLLVVRLADQVHYYVNRHYVGSLAVPATVGEVGNVVINYQPQDTLCQFADTWVWRLD